MRKVNYVFLSFALLALCMTLGFPATPVLAGEGFGSHYPGGNEDFMAGALPPAGTNIFLNYLVDYNIGQLKDNAGRDSVVNAHGLQLPVKTDVNVLVDALRPVRVTKIKLLGGDLVIHAIIPFGYVHASNMVELPNGATAYGSGFPSTGWSLGDIEFGAGIAWHPSPTFHHIFAFDVVAPTGAYEAASGGAGGGTSRTFVANPANLGRNYWSFDPLWAFTYIGDKNSPVPGLEFSAKLMYWINTVNTATSYVSGQEFSADYLVGYHINKQLAFGANGFFLYQTTDDRQFGSTAVDPLSGLQTGVRGKDLSIGPAITYDIPHGCLTFKYQHDIWEENRPAGDKFWLKWVYAF